MCLDFTGVNIGQGEFGINSSVNIHLFRCQEKREDIALGIKRCKNNIGLHTLLLVGYSLKKSLNLDIYENPLSYSMLVQSGYNLETRLKVNKLVHYQTETVITKKGPLGRGEDVKSHMSFKKTVYKYNTRDPRNIQGNYKAIGQLVMQDSLWQMTIIASRTKKVTTRSYFTLMEMFSDIGGIFEFLGVAVFF